MGLDAIERKLSFAGAAAALVLTLVYLSQIGKSTTKAVTTRPTTTNSCPKGFHLAGKLCHGLQTTQSSALVLAIIVGLVMGGGLAFFAFRRNRPGAIVTSLLLGFLTGTAGILFMFLGGWLAIRAFRLQKYGDPTFSGSNTKAKEIAQRRRADRRSASNPRSLRSAKASTGASTTRTPVASKRYTPKKSNRR